MYDNFLILMTSIISCEVTVLAIQYSNCWVANSALTYSFL